MYTTFIWMTNEANRLPITILFNFLKSSDETFFQAFKGALDHANRNLEHDFFWECPPVSKQTLIQPFEFVVIESLALTDATQDHEPFEEHLFDNISEKKPAISFPSKSEGGTVLIIPDVRNKGIENGEVEQFDYKNISQFTKNAPIEQQKEFWQEVAKRLEEELDRDEAPKWLSTHGLGVHHLHVRIDREPKNYQFEEYKRFAKEEAEGEESPNNGNSFSSRRKLAQLELEKYLLEKRLELQNYFVFNLKEVSQEEASLTFEGLMGEDIPLLGAKKIMSSLSQDLTKLMGKNKDSIFFYVGYWSEEHEWEGENLNQKIASGEETYIILDKIKALSNYNEELESLVRIHINIEGEYKIFYNRIEACNFLLENDPLFSK